MKSLKTSSYLFKLPNLYRRKNEAASYVNVSGQQSKVQEGHKS